MKETISKVKRQTSESEKIITNETIDKEFFLGLYINLKNIQATPVVHFKKNKQPSEKMGQRSKQTFIQRRHTDG